MILDGSMVLLGGGDTRMALKGAWGGVWIAAAGSGGTAGKESKGEGPLLWGRTGGMGLTGATSECMSGIDGREGGGRLGGGGCTVTGKGDECHSLTVSASPEVSTSASCNESSSIYSESSLGIGGSGGLPGTSSSSSSYSRTGLGLRTRERRSGDEAEALGPARAS